jgi:hypothetical protein
MDIVAFLVFAFGVVLVRENYTLIGISMVVIPLCALAAVFVRTRSSWLFLPFSYPSWFLALPGVIVLEAIAAKGVYFSPGFPIGLSLYYMGCICLWERQAHYRSWRGEHLTATLEEHPVTYWIVTVLVFLLSGFVLGGAIIMYSTFN